MSERLWISVLGGLSLLWACGNGDPKKVDPKDVSFSEEIAPLFEANCNLCHHPDSAIGYDLGNVFDPDKGIISRENSWAPGGSTYPLVVDPGNPDASFLIPKVRDANLELHIDGNPMPYQVERLSSEEIATVEQWITDGANNDAFFSEQVAPIFGTEISLRRVAGKCSWCHYPGSSTGMSVLDVFDADEGMVGVESSSGGTIVLAGDPANSVLLARLKGDTEGPQMPRHYPRLTEAEVQTLVDWIAAGAPNN